MKYFNSLPYLVTTDYNGNTYALKNLLIRTGLIPQLAKNPLLFYKYDLQDGDTPEIVANKYYGNSYRYWIVLYGNTNILDPQWDWPLSSQQFQAYLIDKYSTAAGGSSHVLTYTQGTIHHYEKVITTVDNSTETTAIKTVEVDLTTYNSIQPFTQTQAFSNGASVTYTLSKNIVSIYDYELQINEGKRNINLINSTYAGATETQFQSLVNS
jgi:Base plate wedge protein 53